MTKIDLCHSVVVRRVQTNFLAEETGQTTKVVGSMEVACMDLMVTKALGTGEIVALRMLGSMEAEGSHPMEPANE
jgi:hypothetical protein